MFTPSVYFHAPTFHPTQLEFQTRDRHNHSNDNHLHSYQPTETKQLIHSVWRLLKNLIYHLLTVVAVALVEDKEDGAFVTSKEWGWPRMLWWVELKVTYPDLLITVRSSTTKEYSDWRSTYLYSFVILGGGGNKLKEPSLTGSPATKGLDSPLSQPAKKGFFGRTWNMKDKLLGLVRKRDLLSNWQVCSNVDKSSWTTVCTRLLNIWLALSLLKCGRGWSNVVQDGRHPQSSSVELWN